MPWTLTDGVFAELFIENMDTTEFSTTSRSEFEAWWKKYTLELYAGKLENTWKF
jgi:hypothetical protein